MRRPVAPQTVRPTDQAPSASRASSHAALWAGALLLTCGALALAGCGAESGSSALVAPPTTDDTRVTIEESDIVRKDGALLYVQNPTTGLNLVDLQNPAQPLRIGRAAVVGTAGELYLHAGYALVLLKSASAGCTPLPETRLTGWTLGAELALVNVKRPSAPRIVARHCLRGSLVATRLVNDFLFVVTTSEARDSEGATARATAIDVSDPAAAYALQELPLLGASKEIHVTDDALYVAAWTNPGTGSSGAASDTRLDIVTIDPQTGAMRRRGSALVRGEPQGRFHMDLYGTTFRIVTYDRGRAQSRLTVLDVSRPDSPSVMGTLDGLGTSERLYATRFDGDKAYVVTFRNTDPLWIVSLANPARPALLGKLIVPGWSDFIFPRGERLLTVGRAGNGGGVQVSLFDVSDPRNPTSVSQLQLGSLGAQSEANLDHRAVTLVDEPGANPMVVVPYGYGQAGYGCDGEQLVQLVDLTSEGLFARGTAQQAGSVRRTLYENGVLLGVSDLEVRAFDVSERDWPRAAGAAIVGTADAAMCSATSPVAVPQNQWLSNDTRRGRFLLCQAQNGATALPIALAMVFVALGAMRLRRRGAGRARSA